MNKSYYDIEQDLIRIDYILDDIKSYMKRNNLKGIHEIDEFSVVLEDLIELFKEIEEEDEDNE